MDKDMGVPPSGSGLSPSVEPLRASPPVGASIPNAQEKRLKSLARDHFRNARRLAALLVEAQKEIESLKKGRP